MRCLFADNLDRPINHLTYSHAFANRYSIRSCVAAASVCAASPGGSLGSFTLTDADATVGGGAAGITITYHIDLADAMADANAISLLSEYFLQIWSYLNQDW